MKLKNLGINLFLAMVSICCTLLVVEAFFYFASKRARTYPGVFFQTEDPRTMLLCYDDQFAGTPDWDLRQDQPFEKLTNIANTDSDSKLFTLQPCDVPNAIEIRVNKLNFRERSLAELQQQRAPSITTLVVGDSFCFGQGVRTCDRFSDMLESRLNTSPEHSAGKRHVLVNACVPGMNIGRILLVIRQSAGLLNNVRRVIYSYTLNDPIKDKRTRETQKMINDFMHFRNHLFSKSLGPLLDRWKSPTMHWFLERMAKKEVANETIEWYRQMYTNNAGWEQTKDRLIEIHRFCAARNIELTLVVFPLFYNLKDYPLVEVHQILGHFARQHGINYFDLLEIFRGKDEREYWVHPRDFHPNGRAHREAADFLYSAISW